MATVTTLAGSASAGRTAGAIPYLVDVTIDFAAAATAKGSALAAADVVECINVPANTLILNAGFEVITVLGGESNDTALDLGVTGVDADVFVDGFDGDAAAAGAYAQNAAAFQPVVIATADTVTVYFSDLLAGHIWSTGTAGSLDISRVWPNGSDEITGLAAHNGFLFIFGKRQVLIYANATTPSSLSLSDTISNIGCIARDSIANTGSDVVFLSNSGVRSLLRTIQEKSVPLRDLSKNVRDDLMTIVNAETLANIKAVYSESNAFYLINFPTATQTYCFDTKAALQDGSSRVTVWDSITPTAFLAKRNGDLLIGKNGYVGKYGTYLDHTSTYRLQYFTTYADLGQPNVTSILKRIAVVVIGGSNQGFIIKWGYDFSGQYYSTTLSIPASTVAEYGTAQYGANGSPVAYYSQGIALQTLVGQTNGSGKTVQTGYETEINGYPVSIQKIEVDYLVNKARDLAQYYTDRFITYMSYNQASFPEYNANNNADVYPDTDSNFSSWVL